jgi:hypothetical protein
MKTAIFVVGEENSGKSAIIRALTGSIGRRNPWLVMTLSNNRIPVLVVVSALQENQRTKSNPPGDFPERLERLHHVHPTEYELLICPLELSVGRYNPERYLQSFMTNGFDVRVALIRTAWDGAPANSANLSRIQSFINSNGLRSVVLDIASSDEHMQARLVRDNLYPR